MAGKRSHFGMAGQLAAMSEFLLRGYNVAVPAVDVGDDIFVVDDREGLLSLVQVKSSDGRQIEARDEQGRLFKKTVQYNLSRRQLATGKRSQLFFMFLVRWQHYWRFVLIARTELHRLRAEHLESARSGRRGPPPLADEHATSDQLLLQLTWTSDNALGWGGVSLRPWLDQWPEELPELTQGPGAIPSRAPEPRPPDPRSALLLPLEPPDAPPKDP
jgi:hypothetical protein